MKNIFNVALIGCGAISNNHLTPLTNDCRCKIVALCDIKPEKAKAKAESFSLDCKIYTDYKEMLENEQLDSIHICTPHYLHAEMAIAALEKNINVFLEKPMCISTEEIQKLLEAEKKSNAKICVCFQNRFNPATVTAKNIADEDGGVISAYGSIFWERGEKYYTESGWRGSWITEGGGVMINQAIHTIDLLCFFLGKPQKLWATKANHHLKGVIEVEDACEGLVEFENGKRANFYATTSFTGYNATTVFLLTKNHKIEISGQNMFVDGEKVDLDNTLSSYVGKECYGHGHTFIIESFYNAIENNSDVPVSLESAQYALRILLAAYKSNDNETII